MSIHGVVTDIKNNPISDVAICITDNEGNIVQYSLSDKEGVFQIPIKEKREGLLSFSCLGYSKKEYPLGQVHDNMIIQLDEEDFTITEVVVTPDKIRVSGDTITYNISQYKQAQDRSVADVLKRMPGIEVSSGGVIQYQGKNIGTVYVEGMDITGGRYAQVTNNLDADKIGSVQVLDNHQHIKAVRDIEFSNIASINLTLKDKSKGASQWLFDFAAGHSAQEGHDDIIGNCKLMQMNFQKNYQQFNLYRNDYTGNNIIQDIRNMMDNGAGIEQPMLSLISINDAGLLGRLDNSTHLVSSNTLWKKNDDCSLRFQTSACNNVIRNSQSIITEYNVGYSPIVIEENNDIKNRHTEINVELQYLDNRPNVLVDNLLKAYGDFDHEKSVTIRNGSGIVQDVHPRQFYIKDVFRAIKVTDKGKWGMDGLMTVNHLPGRLLIHDGRTQYLTQNVLNGGITMLYSYPYRKTNITMKMGMDMSKAFYSLKFDSLISETASYSCNRFFASWGFSYKSDKLKLSLNIPVNLQLLTHGDNCSTSNLNVSPTLYVDWDMSSFWRIVFSSRYKCIPISFKYMWNSPFYTSYTNLLQGSESMSFANQIGNQLSFLYRDVLNGFCTSLICTNDIRLNTPLFYRLVDDDGIVINKVSDQTGRENVANMTLNISKSWNRLTISTKGSLLWKTNHTYYNGNLEKCTLYGKYCNISLLLGINSWLSVESRGSYYHQEMKFYNSTNISDVLSADNKVYLTAGKWKAEISGAYYFDKQIDNSKIFFLDSSISYNTKVVEYTLSARNLMGTDCYSKTELTDYYSKRTVTTVRPRELLFSVLFSL